MAKLKPIDFANDLRSGARPCASLASLSEPVVRLDRPLLWTAPFSNSHIVTVPQSTCTDSRLTWWHLLARQGAREDASLNLWCKNRGLVADANRRKPNIHTELAHWPLACNADGERKSERKTKAAQWYRVGRSVKVEAPPPALSTLTDRQRDGPLLGFAFGDFRLLCFGVRRIVSVSARE